MKRKLTILLCLLALLTIALFWLLHKQEGMPNQASIPATNAGTLPVTSSPKPSVNRQEPITDAKMPASNQQALPIGDSVTAAEKEAQIRATIEAKNVPFNFYGRAIDQDSNFLPGVKFKLALRHWSTTSLGAIHVEKETDADGCFDVHGVTGDAFDIESVEKDGYELEPGQRSFGAVGGIGENPVVFKMWSTNIHEQLISGTKSFPIVPDGRAYFMNLTTGTISESADGDLKVWIKYTDQVVRGQLYDWSCQIDAINGGLLEEPLGSAMYVAPAAGYVPTFQLQQQIKDGQRGSIGTRRFYLMLKNGQEYGRITIELDAPYNDQIPGMIRLQYVINSSGSRILR
jgi:hypothetical protein